IRINTSGRGELSTPCGRRSGGEPSAIRPYVTPNELNGFRIIRTSGDHLRDGKMPLRGMSRAQDPRLRERADDIVQHSLQTNSVSAITSEAHSHHKAGPHAV